MSEGSTQLDQREYRINELISLLDDERLGKALLEAVKKAETSCPDNSGGADSGRIRALEEKAARQAQELRAAEVFQTGLNRELEQAKEEKRAAEQDLAAQKRQLDELRNALAAEQKRLSPFARVIDAFDRYKMLAATLPGHLAEILPRDDAVHFLVSGSQRDTIERFWDRFQERESELSREQLEDAVYLLEFFLGQYNSLYERPIYQLMKDEIGKPFDNQRHSRSPECSKYQGNVERVVFPGIWNIGQNKALKKSVVYFHKEL